MLVGTSEFIEEARSWRKRLGGGMRQVGILAAAGIIALEKGPGLLERDHRNAKRLANGLAAIPGIKIDPESVVTNIVIFDSAGAKLPVAEIVEKLRDRGVLAIGFGSQIRMVTHLDIADTDIDVALLAMTQIVG